MGRNVYAVLNNCLDILPGWGRAVYMRGQLASRYLKSAAERLGIGLRVNIYNPQNVSMGDDVFIGHSVYMGGGEIVLGDQVMIGPFSAILAGNHTRKDDAYRYGAYEFGRIEIKRGTWLGANVSVTNNVTIGSGCLVAAGAVVTKDMPDNVLIGGVPARVLGPAPGCVAE